MKGSIARFKLNSKESMKIVGQYEKNRMGKTRDLFRRLEIPKEQFMQR